MATAHNPENQAKAHEANNLGQINGTAAAKPWVVVEFPGTRHEAIAKEFCTWGEAMKWADLNKTVENMYCLDIMRRLEDGTLTTEF